ncbi:hypothetical protein UB43_05650, partial [Pseudomonas sp. 21]
MGHQGGVDAGAIGQVGTRDLYAPGAIGGHFGAVVGAVEGERHQVTGQEFTTGLAADGLVGIGFGGVDDVVASHPVDFQGRDRRDQVDVIVGTCRHGRGVASDIGRHEARVDVVIGVGHQFRTRNGDAPLAVGIDGGAVGHIVDDDADDVTRAATRGATGDGLILLGFGQVDDAVAGHRVDVDRGLGRGEDYLVAMVDHDIGGVARGVMGDQGGVDVGCRGEVRTGYGDAPLAIGGDCGAVVVTIEGETDDVALLELTGGLAADDLRDLGFVEVDDVVTGHLVDAQLSDR